MFYVVDLHGKVLGKSSDFSKAVGTAWEHARTGYPVNVEWRKARKDRLEWSVEFTANRDLEA